jgi:hypothetical protein
MAHVRKIHSCIKMQAGVLFLRESSSTALPKVQNSTECPYRTLIINLIYKICGTYTYLWRDVHEPRYRIHQGITHITVARISRINAIDRIPTQSCTSSQCSHFHRRNRKRREGSSIVKTHCHRRRRAPRAHHPLQLVLGRAMFTHGWR